MEPSIGLKKENLTSVAHALNSILADEFVLYTKTRNAHWNVEGPDFYSKHLFFEKQYGELDEIIDSIAERIRALGHYAPGSLKLFLELTHLTEKLHEQNTAEGYIKELLADHESLVIRLREKINEFANAFHDLGTSDFVTGLMETHEKMSWMLRSHLR
ncbi:MAG TPA: DNA starvation/stationary phase protection protein [Mucilaginibacter sp.]|jgi:starvation-inducible DNA-binding protein